MFELTIMVDFEAAHCLPDYPGKCSRLHGHNWKVEVTVEGNQLNQLGMLMDFHELKQETQAVIATLDHYYLNDTEAFSNMNPTSENIAQYIYEKLSDRPAFNNTIQLRSVKVWESPHSAALYRRL